MWLFISVTSPNIISILLLVELRFHFVLWVVSFQEDVIIRDTRIQVAGEQLFSCDKIQCFFKNHLIDYECVAEESAVVGAWKGAHEVGMEMLQGVRIQIRDSLGLDAAAQSIILSLTQEASHL